MAEEMHKTKENVERIDGSMSENIQSYEPYLDPQEEPKISDFSAFIHIMKVTVTAGILFLPNTFRKTGYVMSIICGLFIGVIYIHNSVVLVQCSQTLCRQHNLPKLDLAQTVEVSFLMGPQITRRCAKGFRIFTNIIICFIQYKEVVIYILYVATSFQQVIEYYGEIVMNVRIYVLIFFPIYCILIFVPNLKYLVPFSIVGTIFFILGITTSFIYFLEDFPNPKYLDAFTDVHSIPLFLSIFLYSLHNITILLPLENIMHYPENLTRLIIITTIFNTLIYIIFGFLGYNKYKDTCDTIIKNLPLDEV
ncbi:proton-coupled amino acid transporter-like protein pathetic [Vespula squamosa]|uniref:Proton-coupled amino acid transporter-like protein pathetic n=1 Tax=Vespula squamosa TaxID=30214 RepID=A0ABD2A3I4_VESSQ